MLSFKFAIVKEIGRNPFAVVYDCARKDDRQRVAVKIFNQVRRQRWDVCVCVCVCVCVGHVENRVKSEGLKMTLFS